jgi:hypothetical protein
MAEPQKSGKTGHSDGELARAQSDIAHPAPFAEPTSVNQNQVGKEINRLRLASSLPLESDDFPTLRLEFDRDRRRDRRHGDDSRALSAPALPSDASPLEAEEFMQAGGATFQKGLPELCGDKPVCSVGEAHDSLAAKDYFRSQVEGLAKAGRTFIGFEMIEKRDQHLLDAYLGGSKTALEQLLSNRVFGGFNYGSGVPEMYMTVINAIKNYNDEIKAGARRGQPLTAFAMNNSALEFGQRNELWAQTIEDLMRKNPGAQFVTYSGADHVQRRNYAGRTLLGEALEDRGIASSLISLDSLKSAKISAPLEDAAEGACEAGLKPGTGYFLSSSDGVKRADAAIFVGGEQLKMPPPGQEISRTGDGRRKGSFDIETTAGKGELVVSTGRDGQFLGLQFRIGGSVYNASPARYVRRNKGDERYLEEDRSDLSLRLRRYPDEHPSSGWASYGSHSGSVLYSLKISGVETINVKVDETGALMDIRTPVTLLYPPFDPVRRNCSGGDLP